MRNGLRLIVGLGLIVAVGCTAAPSRPTEGVAAAPPEAADEPRKSLTIAQPRAREGFGPWFMRGSGRILQWEELHSNFLVSTDRDGALEGRLAVKLPSEEDGTLAILPDGRMRSTWKLRPNARWQDGTPVTADDVVFGWEVSAHPEIPVQQSPTFTNIDSIQAPDASTVVINYKSTHYKALELGFRDLYVLPKHLLAAAFEGNKEAFVQLPYFSTEYVHSGPFRVTEFLHGERVVMQRFDDYFLGRPKLHSITVVFIGDDNAIVSNMLAGTVDITGELPDVTVARLRDDWKDTGYGFAVTNQGNWRFISLQFDPEFGRPAEMRTDRRVREALLLAIDRAAIREALVPGFPDTSADTFMVRGDPRTAAVGTPFARYRHDPARAVQLFAEAGWRRGVDGAMVNSRGQRVEMDIRTTGAYEIELSAVANDWRNVGLEVTQEVMTRALSQDREYIARFPSAEITAQSNSDGIFRRFDSRGQPRADNRYVGSNAGHYTNPALDRLLDRLYLTLDERQQAQILKEAGETIAQDLPALPMYFSINGVVALKRVKALDDFAGALRAGTTARNAHLWDVE